MTTATPLGGDCVSPEQPINTFADRLIRRKARELITRFGFSPADREDIEQDLRLLLIRRFDKFDPSVAHYNVFVTTVIERFTATIIEHREAESRAPERSGGSLSRLIDDGDGNQIEKGATLTEDQHALRTGVKFRSDEHLRALAADVADLLNGLSSELFDICRRLQSNTVSGVARELGIPPSTLRDALQRLRPQFEASGMREYL
jgi:RNA polymerase sigma-70 factor (ECF subfamily)